MQARYIYLSLFVFLFQFGFSQQVDPLLTEDVEAQTKWVDSIYNGMTLKEKVGQLFMVDVFSSNRQETHGSGQETH